MGGIRGVGSHRRVIPGHIQRRLLNMPAIDGCWVGISPRKGLKRASIIAVDRQRQEVERRAIERGLSPGDYAIYQVAHKSPSSGEGPDQAFETHEHTNWTRWMGGELFGG